MKSPTAFGWVVSMEDGDHVTPGGVEPPITWMKARCPRPLDDGAVKVEYFIIIWPLVIAFGLKMERFGVKAF